MNPFLSARDALASIHPDVPWVALTAAIWIAQWLVRRYAPRAWDVCFSWIPADTGDMLARVAQGLPSVLAGAAIPALASGGDWRDAATGALFGALAPVWHHVLKAAPVPYRGELRLPPPAP